jgi:hypothetical protein
VNNIEYDTKTVASYLHDIQADGQVAGRIEDVVAIYGKIIGPAQLKDLFVSDSVDPDGTRQFGSLWFFFEDFICEAKNFLADNDFDFSKVTNNAIVYWRIQSKDFDFEKSVEGSRVGIRVDFDNRVNCELAATGKNCEYFMDIFRSYFGREKSEKARKTKPDSPSGAKGKQSLV